jgi:methanethiol S-methyltransferase
MRGLLSAIYSVCAYAFFFVTFCYAIGFVENMVVPKTIDSGVVGDPLTSVLINAALLALFAVQHSVMARPGFKRVWTKIVPAEAERSTYVLAASLALALLLWQWRPLPDLVWSIENPTLAAAIIGLSLAGFGIVLLSTFLISHFHLFGVSQGFARLLRLKEPSSHFVTPLLYRWIRHPLYLGFIIAFWAAPQMSVGHFLFAIATTGYIFVGIFLEERDLMTEFGERYREYRRRVGMLVPKFRAPKSSRETSL